MGVGGEAGAAQAAALAFAGPGDPRPHHRRRLPGHAAAAVARQEAGHVDVQVDAVEQRSAEALAVLREAMLWAPAGVAESPR